MQIVKVSVFLLSCFCYMLVNGCESEQCKDLKVQNNTQARRITELSSDLDAAKLELVQLKRQLADAGSLSDIEKQTLQARIAALERAVKDRSALIDRMKGRLLGGGALPPELSTMLEEFANKEDMVTYDADRGIVKFKSDLLFKSGSDEVLPAAVEAVRSLCAILNSEAAKKFDIIIAGHTDDQPIRYSRAKHPTNWHLSAHRAISVLNVMTGAPIDAKRTSIRGFGEFRPVAENKPNKKGNPQNRRVEIYIVPEGM